MRGRGRAGRGGSSRATRWLALLSTGLLGVLVAAPVASGAPEPSPATLTQLAYDGTTLAGVLTLRATSGDVVVDPASLQVTAAGTTAQATVESATTMRCSSSSTRVGR